VIAVSSAIRANPQRRAGQPVAPDVVPGPTGPDVLAVAAHVLPGVPVGRPFSGDVHAALVVACDALDVDVNRHHRLQLGDEARDLLAAFLVAAGRASPEYRASATLRGWVILQARDDVRQAMVDAAGYWRHVPDPQWGCPASDGDG
jgi:hypothetical protein